MLDSAGFDDFESSVRPSEETLTLVMDVGSALPLLDLRLVKNLVGESSFGDFAWSPGSSPVVPYVTPMLSFAVLTIAGAFARQLPDPPSHFLPFGVCVPDDAAVDASLFVRVDSAMDALEGLGCKTSLLLGVFVVLDAAVVLAVDGASWLVLLSVPGTSGFGLDFLRGFIRTGKLKGLNKRKDLLEVSAQMQYVTCLVYLHARGRTAVLLAFHSSDDVHVPAATATVHPCMFCRRPPP